MNDPNIIQRLREAIATRGKPRMEAALAAVEKELAAKDAEIEKLQIELGNAYAIYKSALKK